LSIRLPDTRLLVAVCSDKTEFLAGFRDCRVPPAGADVFMESKGESVKLHWREVSGVTDFERVGEVVMLYVIAALLFLILLALLNRPNPVDVARAAERLKEIEERQARGDNYY
jgi:hypothetical protein